MRKFLVRVAIFTFLIIFMSCGAANDNKEVLATNALVNGLEDGKWTIIQNSNDSIYSIGNYNRGVKVDLWKYHTPDSTFNLQYKRNPVVLGKLRLGVPVHWYEVESSQFDFIALDTLKGKQTIIINTVNSEKFPGSLKDFSRLALSGVTKSDEYNVASCDARLVHLSNGDSLVLVQSKYFDLVDKVNMYSQCVYKRIGDSTLLDAGVHGELQDTSLTKFIVLDFIQNIVFDTSKVVPYNARIESSVSFSCM